MSGLLTTLLTTTSTGEDVTEFPEASYALATHRCVLLVDVAVFQKYLAVVPNGRVSSAGEGLRCAG